jgi:A/G-specific adenine glycosylase
MITVHTVSDFKNHIWNFYRTHGRQFPWRHVEDPYKVVVSEIMLQQTQTYRVEPKYAAFIDALPTIHDLAAADLRTVLGLWQGLGYNRRGKFLHEMAKEIVQHHGGLIPNDPTLLVQLPGIGKATAGSICAFAFNKPTLFIETNIRAVYIHHFFPGRHDVHDNELMPLITATVDQENPREWYYALMDYGVHLKKTMPNPSRKSKHHVIQSKFEGSDRQIRGAIIRTLTKHAMLDRGELIALVSPDYARTERILDGLIAEKLVFMHKNMVFIG